MPSHHAARSRWRIMNADSDSLQSRACSVRVTDFPGRTSILRACRPPHSNARGPSRRPRPRYTRDGCLAGREPRRGARPHAHEPTRARLRKRLCACVASARPADASRGPARPARLALGPAAAAQRPSPRTSRSPARRARTGGGAVGLLALLVPVAGFLAFQAGKGGGAAGDDDSNPPPPGLRIPKTIKKISPSRAAKTASAGTRPSPRTCESRGGSRGETNGD